MTPSAGLTATPSVSPSALPSANPAPTEYIYSCSESVKVTEDNPEYPYDESSIDIKTMDSDEGMGTLNFVQTYTGPNECLDSLLLYYTNEDGEEICKQSSPVLSGDIISVDIKCSGNMASLGIFSGDEDSPDFASANASGPPVCGSFPVPRARYGCTGVQSF